MELGNALADDPRTTRVDYRIGWNEYRSEWICFEHEGYARHKAVQWWTKRSPDPVSDNVEHAVDLANSGALVQTRHGTVRAIAGDKYNRIVGYELAGMPEPVSAVADISLEGVPF